jgi:integrase/recombinase XerC
MGADHTFADIGTVRVPPPDGPISLRFDPRRRAWFGRWRDAAGRRRHQKLGTTRGEAEAKAYRIFHAGRPAAGMDDPRQAVLGELVDIYLEERRRAGVDPKQLRDIGSVLRRFFTAARATTAGQVTREALELYLDGLQKAGRAGRTVNKHRGHVRGFFAWCLRSDRLAHDPVKGVGPRSQVRETRVRRAIALGDVRGIIAAAKRPDARPWEPVAYAVAFLAGLRQGEILGLTWGNLDLEEATYNLKPWQQKSKAENTVPIFPELVGVLKAHLAKVTAALEEAPADSDRVLEIRDPSRNWKRTLKAAGIAYKTPGGKVLDWHAMRHTFCTLLGMDTSIDMKTKQHLMRHADISMTARYDHSGIERQRDALERLQAVFCEEAA